MRAFSFVPFLFTLFAPACARHASTREPSQVSTAAPPSDCTVVGRASGSATEATESMAMSRARESLAADGERLAGTYVQITGQDVIPVEMAINAVQVRLEGRVYRCAEADAGRPGAAVAMQSDASDEAMPTAIVAFTDVSDARCAAPAEPRELEPNEGPGWQCARRVGEGWVADGRYVVYWPGGAIKVEGGFENGRRSGRWSFYYSNGQVRERATYRDGQFDGCAERFDSEGTPQSQPCAGNGDAGK